MKFEFLSNGKLTTIYLNKWERQLIGKSKYCRHYHGNVNSWGLIGVLWAWDFREEKMSNYEFLIFICKNHKAFPVKGDIQEIEDGSRKTKVFIDDFDNTHLESQKIRAIYHILVAYYIVDTKKNYRNMDEFIKHMQSVTKMIDEFVYLAN